jgi:ABC-type oligopeptide transport system substrate-binding subunit
LRLSRAKLRGVSLGIVGTLGLAACGSSSTASSNLASDQTFAYGMQDDVAHLDPADIDAATDIPILQNMFVGLYKFDDSLKIVPYAATAMPKVSSDGMTYTFSLRKDMKFSNGDPVTASDFVYSWTRAAKHNAAYESNLSPIIGADDVAAGKATTISGLSTPDTYTLVAKLSAPAGYFVTTLAMPTETEVVDKKVVDKAGDAAWTQDASTYIGSGPFKMTARVPKQSMDFAPVANWWGGSTGTLTHVHIDIGIDQASQVKKFESGGYGAVGPSNNLVAPDDVLRYQSDPTKKSLLYLFPGSRVTGLGFNFTNGPFAPGGKVTPGKPTEVTPDAGLLGREAISMAIDRAQLADVACVHAVTCAPATGGPVPKGVLGYLGDNQDPNAKFDAAKAKTLLDQWDPGKTKRNGIVLRYNTSASNDALFGNVQAQLKANLGIDVKLSPSDFPTLLAERKNKTILGLFRESWGMDYNHPQDWFDNLSICAQAGVGKGNNEGYCNPALDTLVAKADTLPLDQAMPTYLQGFQILVKDVAWVSLTYGRDPFVIQKWVKGEGNNGFYDYEWKEVSILQH